MLADDLDLVLGVDTHAEEHALCLLEAQTQRVRRHLTIPASRRGYRQALRLARRQAPGRRLSGRWRAPAPTAPASPVPRRAG
jgi:hypothetical protein